MHIRHGRLITPAVVNDQTETMSDPLKFLSKSSPTGLGSELQNPVDFDPLT